MRLSTKHAVMAAVAIGLAAVLLAACGGGDDGDNGNATAADAGAGIVSVQDVDGTDVLVDSEGSTLYSADVEENGRILCTGACTSFWDPIGASAREAESTAKDLDLDLGVVSRPDGDDQLTLDGLPLYRFTEEEPGQLDGDGFVDDFEGTHFEWEAATASAGSGSAGSGGNLGPTSPY
jgi:predicted lipoprotein with Yx(FWY)xxD motif